MFECLTEVAEFSMPVLLAIDDLQALYGTSLYRDPEFNHIQALHLSMPRQVLEYASGNSAFVSLNTRLAFEANW
jgi:small subunit ribosomal protein S29